MTSKIYIARTELITQFGEHSYFVFDPDGNPDSGDEKIIDLLQKSEFITLNTLTY
jgi:hypothetical protein